ncbi:phage tail protein [Salmonella enterica subsp. enterica serovar Newport]|uniref:phage tail protein n=1 Tax=Salmonella TaxID=590 RepID=UPI000A48C193|nr:phage tail protein [Salmonella enterica]EHL9587427.1 phage tail protein [Salmonella enterica subsp. enterica serovar Saintpaul]EHM8668084.1 phage tail protein [Salmonella enterica subsp. enterica serovar Newport]MCQ3786491.1 phage tail protein [Salmonella enterica subsp. enterica serovar Indiana]HBJ7700214.1 phage tail protein [Salmonella enterica subsp. enterica serovar Goldcoast]HCA3489814.1 phage tail protein [Salmonella enterica subsp. enterica serovar Java]HCZ4715869.1 phage tail prot
MIIGFGNNVVSSLAADITASQTTIQVMPGAGAMFANLLTSDYANSSNPLKTYAKITLTDAKETVFEVCHLTAVNNDMLTVIRGQEGTTAKGWSLNDVIANFATRGSENQFVQIEELQSGHYVAGVAGGTENNLTLELPATYFVNGGVDWTLRTPLVVIPALNNTGASTLQLTMGGRVLGKFPLYKGNKAELSANDIIKDAPVLCVLDNTKTYFSVLNPLEIYLGSRYLQKDQNLADVNDKAQARQSLQLGDSATRNVGTTQGTVAAGDDSRITGALQKSQNGGDIPDKKQFARTIGAVTSTNITFNNASGWYKIATVVMPQATSTAVIKLYGGAGFNVGLFEQAAISELVLRAGNGSPVGITATLWRRSPTSANEVAWVNTSGDTYDIYINIGQHAYWLIAQYDYTGNANVTLYSTPEYSSVQPGNSTSGQTYTLFNSLMKPTYEDVGALPITGGQLNGPLGIGTDNALGGNSIVLGDNDTGFKQDGDGILGIYANNARVGYIDNSGLHLSVDVLTNGGIRAGDGKRLSLTSNNNSTMTATFNLWGDANRPTVIELDDDQGWHLYSQRNPDGSIVFTVNGDITANTLRAGGAIYQNNGDIFGSVWGNSWLSLWINNNFVADVQLGAGTSVVTWNNAGSWPNTPGYVVTSVWKDNQGENIDGINYAPLQKRVGNQWYTVQGGTV